MKQIRRLFRIHRIFVAQELKRMMEYKGDFLVGIIGFLMVQCSNLLFLWIIFNNIPSLMGWSLNEVVFIYGFSLIPKGIDHLFFDNLWGLGYWIVDKGDFDKYLTRPINSWFYVLCEKFCVDALGEIIVGVSMIVYSVMTMPSGISADINWWRLLPVMIVMPFIIMIFTSVKTATAAISFWTKRSGHVTHMCYMTNEFAKYPVKIYNGVIKTAITYILPFALTAYYPAIYILRGESAWSLPVTIGISLALFAVSQFIWHKGIKAYESAGS